MCKNIDNDGTYIISYGINDCESHIATLETDVIESILWYDLNKGEVDLTTRMNCLSSII